MAPEDNGHGGGAWPLWGRRAVSVILLFHIAAIWFGAWGVPPYTSPLLEQTRRWFSNYYELADHGYAYRFYSPDPPPTPIVEAVLVFPDGHEETRRYPDKAVKPRMLYQRYLNMAHALHQDYVTAREAPGGPKTSFLAESMANYLGRLTGCSMVRFYTRMHMVPSPLEVHQFRREQPGRGAELLDDERYFTPRERIGEFPCNAS